MSARRPRGWLRRIGGALALAGIATGCATPSVQRPTSRERLATLGGTGDDPVVSRPLLLIADNQLSNVLVDEMAQRTTVGDDLVDVAVRPMVNDLFSEDVLAHVLTRFGKGEDGRPRDVIHLGDALNIACVNEWQRFEAVMRRAVETGAIGRWVMAPGNHDAYLLGNANGGVFGSRTDLPGGVEAKEIWEEACRSEPGVRRGDPMRKHALIAAYVRALQSQGLVDAPFADCTTRLMEGRLRGTCAFRSSDPAALLQRARVDGHATEYDTTLVQELELGTPNHRIPGIVLDTTDYTRNPSLTRKSLKRIKTMALGAVGIDAPERPCKGIGIAAGACGDVQPVQRGAADSWTDDAPGRAVYLGHHNLYELDDDALLWLAERVSAGSGLYVSAHTHWGYVGAWGYDADDGTPARPVYELNAGSIVDWPPEARTLEVRRRSDGAGTFTSARIDLAAPGECADAPDHSTGPWCYDCYRQVPEQAVGEQSWAMYRHNVLAGLQALERASEELGAGAVPGVGDRVRAGADAFEACRSAPAGPGVEDACAGALATLHDAVGMLRAPPTGVTPEVVAARVAYGRCQSLLASRSEAKDAKGNVRDTATVVRGPIAPAP